ncbi:hypothetical protein [Microbacterium sp. XT11]|uniref:hypothetical protein n=1 Tax=Microbacterium sp. XT11 TaxID=367477 RepID=UPI001E4AB13F|nr:hypothetical protein [Microbacterium sp. XT11]
MTSFVRACARTNDTGVYALRLLRGGPAEVTERLRDLAASRLGGPRAQDRIGIEWRVRDGAVDDVLDVLATDGAGAVTEHGQPLASLIWDTDAALLDPATGEPYSDITAEAFGGFAVDGYGRRLGVSGIRASIGTTASSLSLWLNLPADERLGRAAHHIEEHVPIRLSTKHWRQWLPTRDGSGYRSVKITSPLAG